jgi:hypothetical protein
VRNQFEAMEGVVSVNVDFGDRSATLEVEKGTDTTTLANGLTGGYTAKVRP